MTRQEWLTAPAAAVLLRSLATLAALFLATVELAALIQAHFADMLAICGGRERGGVG